MTITFSTSFLRTVWGILLLAISPILVYGQGFPPSPVTFTISSVPETVKAGEVFNIGVEAEIEGDWHLYSLDVPDGGPIPTTFSTVGENYVFGGDATESETVRSFDPNFDMEIGWHSKKASFTIPAAFYTDINEEQLLELDVRYMVCNDRLCLPPTTRTLDAGIVVAGVAKAPFADANRSAVSVAAEADGEAELSSEAAALLDEGILSFLWIALTAGFAALLTPCVYPMVPLTVSYFTKQSDGSRSKAVFSALAFG